jgi:hypothetical protein
MLSGVAPATVILRTKHLGKFEMIKGGHSQMVLHHFVNLTFRESQGDGC